MLVVIDVGSNPGLSAKITRKYPPCLRSRPKVIGTDVGSTPILRTKKKNTRVSYNGYYSWLPISRRGIVPLYPLQVLK